MLPVSRFKGQPGGIVMTTSPWLSITCDPAPHWLWLASWFQATPPLVFYPPTVWVPEHRHLIQWEHPAVEVVPLLPPLLPQSAFYPLPKLAEGWITPEEVGKFPGRDKHLIASQILQTPGGHAHRTRLLLHPSRLTGLARRDTVKSRATKTEDSSFPPLLHMLSVSPLHMPLLTVPPPTPEPGLLSSSGGTYDKRGELHMAVSKGTWPLILTNQPHREACLQPIISLERRPSPLLQVMDIHPSFFSSQLSSRFTLLTHKKQRIGGGKVSYEGALLLRTETTTDNNKRCVVSLHKEDNEDEDEEQGEEGEGKDKRPVASTPVPGSPWCVVWTGDDRVFFFNPTIHLSVWERPGDLIGRDISRIIDDPPHKRKKETPTDKDGIRNEDKEDEHKHKSKKSRTVGSDSSVPHPGDIQLLPLELRVAHFRDMMLERGVSAFSTWEKELHKMVFDPRYLLLTSDQRKQVFDQFVKSRVKEEYKEKKSKLQKAREEFKQLLEEGKITSSSTFKEFSAHYRNDQRFSALNSKKEQEVLFNHYISSLKKRDKENRTRLRKMR